MCVHLSRQGTDGILLKEMKDSREFPNSTYPHRDASSVNQKQHYENLSNLRSKWGCQMLKKID